MARGASSTPQLAPRHLQGLLLAVLLLEEPPPRPVVEMFQVKHMVQ